MIGSETRLVAIIGSPIVQVKSPDNFNRYYADDGVERAMMVIDLVPEPLPISSQQSAAGRIWMASSSPFPTRPQSPRWSMNSVQKRCFSVLRMW